MIYSIRIHVYIACCLDHLLHCRQQTRRHVVHALPREEQAFASAGKISQRPISPIKVPPEGEIERRTQTKKSKEPGISGARVFVGLLILLNNVGHVIRDAGRLVSWATKPELIVSEINKLAIGPVSHRFITLKHTGVVIGKATSSMQRLQFDQAFVQNESGTIRWLLSKTDVVQDSVSFGMNVTGLNIQLARTLAHQSFA